MKTVQEQRAMILRKLYWMKKDQDEGKALKCIVELRRAIRKAMEIKPVDKKVVMLPSYFKNGRDYGVLEDVYSAEDNAKVDEIIRRMEAQGFIKIHQKTGYQDVEVLKTK